MAARYCEYCEMWLNGPTQWEEHLDGKKHNKNTRREGRRRTVEEMEIVIPKGTALIIEQTALFKDAVEVFMLSLYRRCLLRCRL